MRGHAGYLRVAYGASQRRSCQVLTFRRSTCRYESVADEQADLRMRIRDLAQAPGELWVSAHPRAAEKGGMAGEPQAGIQIVQPGRDCV